MHILQKNTQPIHKHTLVRAYEYDGPRDTTEARKCYRYNKGPRWILYWACTTCPFREAFDLTHNNPKKKEHHHAK